MDDKKKGLAALLVAKMPKGDDKAEHEPSGKEMAAEDMLRAFEEKDVEGLKEALSAFIEHCD